MIAAVLSGFVVAALLLTGRFLKGKLLLAPVVVPAALFGYFISLVREVHVKGVLLYHCSWIPSLGVNLDFRLDGLSLLFCLLITGIGMLVFIYASSYLRRTPHPERFFGWLCVFMASMLGLVLAENIALLFVCWELTSLSSFFLIGFENKDADARKSALIALSVTGAGGFFLLAGLVLMAGIYDSYMLEAMFLSDIALEDHSLYPLLIFLLLVGALTKSAQFPFHFWLPRAMEAPTPVSAYLHSATMVKAGIYLLARFTPLAGNSELWRSSLLIVGAVTMLFGAVHAVVRTDMKAILAYSTISALGLLVFLLGMRNEAAIIACVVFIAVHAMYKAALFFVAGGLYHGVATRDVIRLGGYGKVLLVLAVAGILAASSGGGIPFTFGFIGKDLIYAATTSSAYPVFFTALALLTNVLLLYAAFLVGVKPFIGKLRDAPEKIRVPSFRLWFPPLALSVAGIAIALFPEWLAQGFIGPATSLVNGMTVPVSLSVWHGFNLVLLLSAITLALGIAVSFVWSPPPKEATSIGRFDAVAPETLLWRASRSIERFSLWYTRKLQNGYLRAYLITIIVFLTVIVAYKFFTEVNIDMAGFAWSEIRVYEALVSLLMCGAIAMTLSARSRLAAILSMSVVGYCICLFFVLFSAPDLAMTQFAIDTLTIVLFVLVLLRLPPFVRHTNRRLKIRDGIISLCFGTLIAAIALQVLNEPTNKEVSRFYADNAYLEGKGKNVVNVILVDFRGFDTLVEITVLTIAAIGVYSLLKLKIKPSEKE